ncbi:hypothetical protein EV363DRAFT_713045 [Boletus edulis]|nr:hypothetical protein EV363DRAFT_713045 [Boletus edulis]
MISLGLTVIVRLVSEARPLGYGDFPCERFKGEVKWSAWSAPMATTSLPFERKPNASLSRRSTNSSCHTDGEYVQLSPPRSIRFLGKI